MRSVAVVFPASMCAMIPMFRQRFRATVRATAISSLRALSARGFLGSAGPKLQTLPSRRIVLPGFKSSAFRAARLPAVVGKGLVGLGHAVNVFLLLHRRAAPVGRIQQLVAQLVGHALFAAVAAIGDQPADGQRGAPVGIDLDRHLVVGAAHAPGLHLKQRLAILDSLLEELEGIVAAALLLEVLHRLIEDALGRRLLAAPHHRVDKLGDQRGPVDRIRRNFPLRNVPFSRHNPQNPRACAPKSLPKSGSKYRAPEPSYFLPLAGAAPPLARLAPYFDRLCLRLATPTESSVPRTTW